MMRKPGPLFRFVLVLAFSAPLLLLAACATTREDAFGGPKKSTYSRIYLTDFNTAWQSVLDSLKHSRLDVSNREAGFVQTRWTDNTAERNLTDSFGSADSYLKAQYRFSVTVAKGYFEGEASVKVTVQKEQVVQRDVLEGWRPVSTDAIDENTLLYRVGRLIYVKSRLAQIEEERTNAQIEASQGDLGGDSTEKTPKKPGASRKKKSQGSDSLEFGDEPQGDAPQGDEAAPSGGNSDSLDDF